MKQESKKFDLSVLKADNLSEISGFEKSQNELVKENPFVKITDKESYNLAKKRRSNLKAGRKTIENQDKNIGSFVSNFRKKVIEISKNLVEITKPFEEKQQTEIDIWESKIKEEKEREKKKEELRVEAIKEKINVTRLNLEALINEMVFNNIKPTRDQINEIIEESKKFDYEEFLVLFNDMKDEMIENYQKSSSLIIDKEEVRKQNLNNEIKLKINDIESNLTSLIFNATTENEGLTDEVEKALFELDFDFGDMKPEFESMKIKILKMTENKETVLCETRERNEELKKMKSERDHQSKVNEQRVRIQEVREGYLDLIHQINNENLKHNVESLTNVLDNPSSVLEELKGEFETMISDVKLRLKEKESIIQNEIAESKKEEERQQLNNEKILQKRSDEIVKVGMIEMEDGDFSGFGIVIGAERLLEEDDMDFILKDIEEARTNEIEFNEKKELVESSGLLMEDPMINEWKGFGLSISKDYLTTNSIEEVKKLVQEKMLENEHFLKRQEVLKPEKTSLFEYVNNVVSKECNFDSYSEIDETKDLIKELQFKHQEYLTELNKAINNFI